MKENKSIQYEPPVTEVVGLKVEGIICYSEIVFSGFGEEEVW